MVLASKREITREVIMTEFPNVCAATSNHTREWRQVNL